MARERRSACRKLSTNASPLPRARVGGLPSGLDIGTRSPRTRGRADGGTLAAVGIVAVVLLLTLGGVGAWVSRQQTEQARALAVEELATAHTRAGRAHAAAERAARPGNGRGALEADVRTLDPDRALTPPAPDRFDGRGSITGSISVPDGQASPPEWTIELVPSATLTGGNRAEYRRLDFTDGETEFAFEDLPLGGYEILVTATGLQAPPWQVLLAKGSADARVSIGLKPFGRLEGRVVDTEGRPVDELPVFLKPKTRGAALEAETDAAGTFLFEGVTDGSWELRVGAVTNPLVPALDVDYSAPGPALETIEVPALGTLDVTVLDDVGTVVAGAQISGYGTTGGMLRTETDQAGHARLRFLPPGPFKMFVTHELLGSAAHSETIEAGATAEVTVRLVPR